uniref:Modulator of VRAC current 1 n=1 Tax=Gasterosteus aculeatus aculeatus TaxID=481459 RepID=A0AAQ4Q0K9_GASAC
MQCDELSAREEFTYSHMPTLERGGGTLGRRGERGGERTPGERYRPERDSSTVDVRASDLQLSQPEPLKHPCFSYRAWLYSVLIGGSLLITSGFSLYLGNVFPVAMDYLRCAAGSVSDRRANAITVTLLSLFSFLFLSDFQVVYVKAFLCVFVCSQINFNLILMPLLEVLMSSTVILSARSAEDCCCHRKPSSDVSPRLRSVSFTLPTRLLKAYPVIIVCISAVFGGIIALNMDALLPGPYLSITFFWMLVACFLSAIVEVLIAISSVTSPLLFSASGFLSSTVINFIDIFLHDVPTQSYDILLVILMVLLLLQAILTAATVVHCASYKSQLCMGAPEYHDRMQTAGGTLQDSDKYQAWKAVVVQMAQ